MQRKKNFVTTPTDGDLKETLQSLANLQQIYNLSISDIVSGKTNNGETGNENTMLQSDDCYEIGRIFFDWKDYPIAYQWMEYSMSLTQHEANAERLFETKNILNYTYQCLNETGFTDRKTLSELKRILNTEPNGDQIKGVLYSLNESKRTRSFSVKNKEATEDDVSEKYKTLCNSKKASSALDSNLFCHYQKSTPYTILSPLKVEQICIEPSVRIFRQVISDEEIERIISLAQPKLERGKVVKGYGTDKDRIAKLAWLYNWENEILNTVDRRLHDMTGLNITFAEQLQKTPLIDRVTTVMFYLSSPEAGGATVFPLLNLTLFPTKNDAVMWYSMLRNGEIDQRSKHAGCPVLSGSKWIANKWICERGQEFLRPCTLDKSQ